MGEISLEGVAKNFFKQTTTRKNSRKERLKKTKTRKLVRELRWKTQTKYSEKRRL